MKMPKNGSLWSSAQGNTFRVLHTIEIDGQIWVHYIKDSGNEEYSCHLESFLSRFWETAE
jgi:hypothetical protein